MTDENGIPYLFDYVHFSIAMNKDRKSPIFTAQNVDGEEMEVIFKKNLKNKKFKLDKREEIADYQIPNSAYKGSGYDRGHQVKRTQPGWGNYSESNLAQSLTYTYSNVCFQHPRFNQEEWLRLENQTDYIIGEAKGSIFTGPVFQKSDPWLNGYQIPQYYWKILVRDDQLKRAWLMEHDTKNPKSSATTWQNNEEEKQIIKKSECSISDISELTGLIFNF